MSVGIGLLHKPLPGRTMQFLRLMWLAFPLLVALSVSIQSNS